ncbi:hypothetical protein [Streptomyces hydrogenans]
MFIPDIHPALFFAGFGAVVGGTVAVLSVAGTWIATRVAIRRGRK